MMQDSIQTDRIIDFSNLEAQISNAEEGLVFLINKPLSWTSFDVVNKLRFALRHATGNRKIKVGHAGTLDPLATGLLLVCVGKYTKKIDELTSMSKAYVAKVKFGAETASYDAECEEENLKPELVPASVNELESVLGAFRGHIMQTPPLYSAIKINGKEAYKIARSGKTAELKQRPVNIIELKVVSYAAPFAELFIECTKGTYIRSMAHDIGQELGCGAYLTGLVRTSIDEYQNEKAISVDDAVQFIQEKIIKKQD